VLAAMACRLGSGAYLSPTDPQKNGMAIFSAAPLSTRTTPNQLPNRDVTEDLRALEANARRYCRISGADLGRSSAESCRI
jgi:hypothetical protein